MKEKVAVYKLVLIGAKNNHIMYGTKEDIRTHIKNQWKDEVIQKDLKEIFPIEEDYYAYLDEDVNLTMQLFMFGVEAEIICEVPIEDFYE